LSEDPAAFGGIDFRLSEDPAAFGGIDFRLSEDPAALVFRVENKEN
jgi:hypothetical protein